jgi:hypothetical protein
VAEYFKYFLSNAATVLFFICIRYDNEIKNNKDESPQEVPKRFPQYKEHIKELNEVNHRLIYYKEQLKYKPH